MGKKHTVLIVDDKNENRLLLQKIIASAGYDTLEAENGKEGLKITRLHKPDFIISDVLMPEMDGFQFCREIKKDDELKHIPFVFYTATYVDKKDADFGLSLGAEKYLMKPLEPGILLNMVEDIIEKHKKGEFAEPRKVIKDEKEVFKQYSERLVNKLEKKTLDLEKEIIQRTKVEKALKESESKFRLLADNTYDWEYWVDLDGKFIYLSPSCERITGYSPEEFLSDPQLIYKIVKPDYAEKVHPHYFNESNKQALVFSIEYPIIKKNGEEVWLEHNCNPVYDDQGNYAGRRGNNRDITIQKKAAEKLQKSEAHLRTLIRTIPDLVWLKDLKGIYLSCNSRIESLFGTKEKDIIGKTDYDFVDKETAAFFRKNDNEAMAKGKPSINEEELVFADDGHREILETIKTPMYREDGQLIGVLGIGRDITERVNLQAQLVQAQKMESVGRLAGGVAHDYNNALSVIMGYTEMIMTDIDQSGQMHNDLNEVLKAATRATNITRQLLAFARKQTIAPKVIDLNENVEGMLKMLRRLIGEDIDFAWLPGTGLWSVKMDPSQIDQILANLCVNARDAIEGVGKVTIETAKMVFDAVYCSEHTGFVPGEFVLLAVSDNGCGMDKEILDNIFEPFFTTKDVDKGTGLGLATVYGIVKQNKGFINVYSEPGKGTTIKIYLPRHESPAEELQKESTEKIPQSQGEVILLVEDDPSILKLIEKTLNGLGYNVLPSNSPKEAMKLVKEYTDKIHLIFTDVIMPEMNGHELSEQLKLLYPDLKCIFMSGYTADAIVNHGVLEEGVSFIQKPFSTRDLAIIVRKELDG